MSGFLFSTAGLRDSWRYSSYPDLSRLGSSQDVPRNRKSVARPSWVRFPSDLHLTALPELPPPPPSKLRLSHGTKEPATNISRNLSKASRKSSLHYSESIGKRSTDGILREKPVVPFNRQYDRPWLKQEPPKPWYSQLIETVYGNEEAEEEPPPLEDDQTVYPKGFKWFLLLLSGALPYVVVRNDKRVVLYVVMLINDTGCLR